MLNDNWRISEINGGEILQSYLVQY
jgi:hypothetical protein